jgi:RNA polymerase sigma-70 factor (ECF subfamily)
MAMPDKSSFIELYSREQKRIFLYILSMVHHQTDAEDIMQLTASEMWHRFDRFEAGTNFVSWGIAIAKYKILDYRRQKNANRLFLSQEIYDQINEELRKSEAYSEKMKNALQGCLGKLKEPDRQKISMHYDAGLSYSQIAQQLNTSVTGIYKVMARIHANLHCCVKQTLLLWG